MGERAEQRRAARLARQNSRRDHRSERQAARQAGRSYRIGEGGGSNFADSIGAVGSAATGIIGAAMGGGGAGAPESQVIAAGETPPPAGASVAGGWPSWAVPAGIATALGGVVLILKGKS